MLSSPRNPPGKKLFQIQIVDRHGLKPSRTKLALRSIVQFLPVWAGPIGRLIGVTHVEALGLLVLAIALAVLLADAAVAAFNPRGRSLHDYLFGTRVVLDAGAG